MSFNESRRCLDIAFITHGKSEGDSKRKSENGFLRILVSVLMTLLLVAIGYFAGWRAGYFAPPQDVCCIGAIDLDLDFDFDRAAPESALVVSSH